MPGTARRCSSCDREDDHAHQQHRRLLSAGVEAVQQRRLRPSKRSLTQTQQNTSSLAPSRPTQSWAATHKRRGVGHIDSRIGFEGAATGGYSGLFGQRRLGGHDDGDAGFGRYRSSRSSVAVSSSDPRRVVVHPKPTASFNSTTSSFRIFMPYRFKIPDEGYADLNGSEGGEGANATSSEAHHKQSQLALRPRSANEKANLSPTLGRAKVHHAVRFPPPPSSEEESTDESSSPDPGRPSAPRHIADATPPAATTAVSDFNVEMAVSRGNASLDTFYGHKRDRKATVVTANSPHSLQRRNSAPLMRSEGTFKEAARRSSFGTSPSVAEQTPRQQRASTRGDGGDVSTAGGGSLHISPIFSMLNTPSLVSGAADGATPTPRFTIPKEYDDEEAQPAATSQVEEIPQERINPSHLVPSSLSEPPGAIRTTTSETSATSVTSNGVARHQQQGNDKRQRESVAAVAHYAAEKIKQDMVSHGGHLPTYEVRGGHASPMRVRQVHQVDQAIQSQTTELSSRVKIEKRSTITTTKDDNSYSAGGGGGATIRPVLVGYISDLEDERENLLQQLEAAEYARNEARTHQLALQREVESAKHELLSAAASLRRQKMEAPLHNHNLQHRLRAASQEPEAARVAPPPPQPPVAQLSTKVPARVTLNHNTQTETRRFSHSAVQADLTQTQPNHNALSSKQSLRGAPPNPRRKQSTIPHDTPSLLPVTAGDGSQSARRHDRERSVATQSTLAMWVGPQGVAAQTDTDDIPLASDSLSSEPPRRQPAPTAAGPRLPRVLISPMPSASDKVLQHVHRLQEDLRKIGTKVEITEALVAHSVAGSFAGSVANTSFHSATGFPYASGAERNPPQQHHHHQPYRSASVLSTISEGYYPQHVGGNGGSRGSPADQSLAFATNTFAASLNAPPYELLHYSQQQGMLMDAAGSPVTGRQQQLHGGPQHHHNSRSPSAQHAAYSSESAIGNHSFGASSRHTLSNSQRVQQSAAAHPQSRRYLMSPHREASDISGGTTSLQQSTSVHYARDHHHSSISNHHYGSRIGQRGNGSNMADSTLSQSAMDHHHHHHHHRNIEYEAPMTMVSSSTTAASAGLGYHNPSWDERNALLSSSEPRDLVHTAVFTTTSALHQQQQYTTYSDRSISPPRQSRYVSPAGEVFDVPTDLERLALLESPRHNPVMTAAPVVSPPLRPLTPLAVTSTTSTHNPGPFRSAVVGDDVPLLTNPSISPPSSSERSFVRHQRTASPPTSPPAAAVAVLAPHHHEHSILSAKPINDFPARALSQQASVSPPTLSQYIDEEWSSPQASGEPRRRIALEDLRFSPDSDEDDSEETDAALVLERQSLSPQAVERDVAIVVPSTRFGVILPEEMRLE